MGVVGVVGTRWGDQVEVPGGGTSGHQVGGLVGTRWGD